MIRQSSTTSSRRWTATQPLCGGARSARAPCRAAVVKPRLGAAGGDRDGAACDGRGGGGDADPGRPAMLLPRRSRRSLSWTGASASLSEEPRASVSSHAKLYNMIRTCYAVWHVGKQHSTGDNG